MNEQPPHITFHTRPWTLGDLLMAQRLERNSQDVDALVALLVSRSDATEQMILDLPIEHLGPIIAQLDESIKTMGLLSILSQNWQTDKQQQGD